MARDSVKSSAAAGSALAAGVGAGAGEPPPALTRVQSSASLQALRELIEVSAHVSPSIARRAGLSRSELETLEMLLRGPSGPTDIARHLDVTSAASSGIVDRLVDRGHAQRVPHPEDRRRVEVHITPSAHAEVIGHLMPMFEGLADFDSRLSDADRAVVERYLRDAIAAIERLL